MKPALLLPAALVAAIAAGALLGPACGPRAAPEPQESSFQRIKVNSGPITALAYSAEARVLRVHFEDGSATDYLDVPESKFVEAIAAYSAEEYLKARVEGRFKTRARP